MSCVECRKNNHAKSQCPATGRCGDCGEDWPCAEHKMKHQGHRRPLNFDQPVAERAFRALSKAAGGLDWCEQALEAVREIATRKEEFTADDVWELVGAPPEPRNMGNVMRKAQRECYCESTDRTVARKDNKHGDQLRVWRSLLWE